MDTESDFAEAPPAPGPEPSSFDSDVRLAYRFRQLILASALRGNLLAQLPFDPALFSATDRLPSPHRRIANVIAEYFAKYGVPPSDGVFQQLMAEAAAKLSPEERAVVEQDTAEVLKVEVPSVTPPDVLDKIRAELELQAMRRGLLAAANELNKKGRAGLPKMRELLAKAVEPIAIAGTNGRPRLYSIAEAQEKVGQQTEWLVDRMFAVGDMSILVAKPGVGKSTFGAQLTGAVAYGKPFLGRRTQGGVVVYFAFEGASSTMAQMVRLGADPASPNIRIWLDEPGVQDPAAWLAGILADVTPSLIIVDTLTDLVKISRGASNAGYQETIEKLGAILRMAEAKRWHVHFMHHGSKGEREGIDAALGTIGNVGKPGTVLDYRLLDARNENSQRVLKGVKHRRGDKEVDLPAVVLNFDRDRGLTVAGARQEVALRLVGEQIIREVMARPGVREQDVLQRIGVRREVALDALRALLEPDGPLATEGTARSRIDPLRLVVRPGAENPIDLWRNKRAPRAPELRPDEEP